MGAILSGAHCFTHVHWMLTTWGKYCDEAYSSDEETEAPSGKSLRSGQMGPWAQVAWLQWPFLSLACTLHPLDLLMVHRWVTWRDLGKRMRMEMDFEVREVKKNKRQEVRSWAVRKRSRPGFGRSDKVWGTGEQGLSVDVRMGVNPLFPTKTFVYQEWDPH